MRHKLPHIGRALRCDKDRAPGGRREHWIVDTGALVQCKIERRHGCNATTPAKQQNQLRDHEQFSVRERKKEKKQRRDPSIVSLRRFCHRKKGDDKRKNAEEEEKQRETDRKREQKVKMKMKVKVKERQKRDSTISNKNVHRGYCIDASAKISTESILMTSTDRVKETRRKIEFQ